MGNAVLHFEVGAADDEPLVAFYGELFGWGLQGFSGGGYTMVDTRGGGGINGGIGKSRTGEPWSTFYVETGDPQATLDKANSLGGTTVMPATDFGGAVTIAMFNDPDGLLVGLVRAAADPAQEGGPAPSAGSGAPVTWFEVMGSDAARTQRFYADLFGWTLDGSAFPGYATVDTGTGRGIQGGLGGGEESRWATIYAKVADVDQAFGHAEKLGGSRIADPGVPALKAAARAALYGSTGDGMQTGAFRDPAGNVFGIFSY
ncbi:MAG TPA: VOC family protein [Streptosporangiaceae bacterium]|nr:VOC family protein [Streptosporangiaceae bacterium]